MSHLDDIQLGAILDGESSEGREHLGRCALCRGELDALRRLETLLQVGRAGGGARRRRLWIPVSIAAGILFAVALSLMQPPPPRSGVEIAVASESDRIQALADLLESEDPRVQISAAKALARIQSAHVREILLASRAAQGYVGGEIDLLAPSAYVDASDDLADGLKAVVDHPDYRDFVLSEFPRVDLLAVIKSNDPELQAQAVVLILKTRNPRFTLVELIELIDVPALRDKILQILPKATDEDFGADTERWRELIRTKYAGRKSFSEES